MKYGLVVRTRSNGDRIYGPYDAEVAIEAFQRMEARILDIQTQGYSEDAVKLADDPVEVSLATFDLTPEEQRRAEAEALVRERSS